MTSHLPLFQSVRVAIRGGGDLASGVAYRLFRGGFPLMITELAHPLLLRRAVSFGSAVIEGVVTVEGVAARRVESVSQAAQAQAAGDIPVIIDPQGETLAEYAPTVVIDARMLKKASPSRAHRPPLLIGLGPGLEAPRDCDVVIETNRGHRLGRVIGQGAAESDTGKPDGVMGHRADRVLRSPTGGPITAVARIGERLLEGEIIAQVDNQFIVAPFDGVLRGLIHDGIEVKAGDKVGDLDPRGEPQNSFTISDKALAVGGGVLEAVLSSPVIQSLIRNSREAG